MKITVLSNINLFKLVNRLKKEAEVYEPEGYGSWIQCLMGEKIHGEYVFCFIDGNQLLSGINILNEPEKGKKLIEDSLDYAADAARRHPETQYVISDLDILPDRLYTLKETGYLGCLELKWKEKLAALAEQYENIYEFPLKAIVCCLGRKNAYSEKMWYLASSRFSNRAEALISSMILQMIPAFKGKRKKCLLLDLDNTLWGGVAGEDGAEGILLSEYKEGARYKDFQRHIKSLKEQGILLGIVSKNNEEDARDIIENHSDMILRWEDFAIRKINWERKSENIRQIQKELNIGLDSIVFIDDSPAEQEEVRQTLPEVCVPEFPQSSSCLGDFIQEIYWKYFLTAKVTREDTVKTEMYHQKQEREEEKRNHISLEEYFKSLHTKISVKPLREEEVGRAMQLLNKTNQFNLTTRRYTETQIRNWLQDASYDLWIAEIRDRFGNNGKSALVIVQRKETAVRIDTFIMSCRVMGRQIEDSILYELERYYQRQGYKKAEASYIKTQKNKPAEEFYDRMGYTVLKAGEGRKEYEFVLKERKEPEFSEIEWKGKEKI